MTSQVNGFKLILIVFFLLMNLPSEGNLPYLYFTCIIDRADYLLIVWSAVLQVAYCNNFLFLGVRVTLLPFRVVLDKASSQV